MAVVVNNPMLEGLSGRIGDLVFRVRGGRTIVSRRPRRSPGPRKTTPRRQAVLSRFAAAVAFARGARDRRDFRSLARLLRGYSPYHLAIQDHLSMPVIEQIETLSQAPEGPQGSPPPARALRVRVYEPVALRTVQASLEVGAGADRAGSVRLRAVRTEVRPGRTAAPDTAPAPRGPGTPAQLYFAGPSGKARGEKIAEPRTSEQEAGAARGSGERSPGAKTPEAPEGRRRRPPLPGQTSVWRIEVPGPGEVEIVAADYAGNRATARLRIKA